MANHWTNHAWAPNKTFYHFRSDSSLFWSPQGRERSLSRPRFPRANGGIDFFSLSVPTSAGSPQEAFSHRDRLSLPNSAKTFSFQLTSFHDGRISMMASTLHRWPSCCPSLLPQGSMWLKPLWVFLIHLRHETSIWDPLSLLYRCSSQR